MTSHQEQVVVLLQMLPLLITSTTLQPPCWLVHLKLRCGGFLAFSLKSSSLLALLSPPGEAWPLPLAALVTLPT